MKMTDSDFELFYKQLKEDISDRANVSIEALKIYFEESGEDNDFTNAFACAEDHAYYKEISELYKPANDLVGVIFAFDEFTSYIDTTTEQTAEETGLFGWIYSYWEEHQSEELKEQFSRMDYEGKLNTLHWNDFLDYMPESTIQIGSKFVVDGYQKHRFYSWLPEFMETCYPTISKIETKLRLNEELSEKPVSMAKQLSNNIQNQQYDYGTKATKSAKTKI